MFLESEFMICRSLIGMKKKNLFNVKYVSVYLMLNALKMKSFDYKSIALPAELQGLAQIYKSKVIFCNTY